MQNTSRILNRQDPALCPVVWATLMTLGQAKKGCSVDVAEGFFDRCCSPMSHINDPLFWVPSFIAVRHDVCFALVLNLVLFWMGHGSTTTKRLVKLVGVMIAFTGS
jgi:hypothetical protein